MFLPVCPHKHTRPVNLGMEGRAYTACLSCRALFYKVPKDLRGGPQTGYGK